jgi:hypothetical protein
MTMIEERPKEVLLGLLFSLDRTRSAVIWEAFRFEALCLYIQL